MKASTRANYQYAPTSAIITRAKQHADMPGHLHAMIAKELFAMAAERAALRQEGRILKSASMSVEQLTVREEA